MIEIHFRVNWMSVGCFPLFDDLSHIGVGHFFVSDWIFKWIWPVFSEEEINDSTHVNVQNQHVRVCVFKHHKGGSKEYPNNDHERNHGNDFFNHPHIRAAFFILVKHCKSIPIEIELGVEIDEPKKVNKRV